MRIQEWLRALIVVAAAATTAHAWEAPTTQSHWPPVRWDDEATLEATSASFITDSTLADTAAPPVVEAQLGDTGLGDPLPPAVTPAEFSSEQHQPLMATELRELPPSEGEPIRWSPPTRGPSLDPQTHEQQLLASTREIVNAGREAMDAGRGMIQSRTPADGEQQGLGDESSPALSNYYGDVTINYVVTPGAGGPQVTRTGFGSLTRLAQHTEGIIEPLPAPMEGMAPVPGFAPDQQSMQGYFDGPMQVSKCDCVCCLNPVSCHRLGVFMDALYMQPGNVDTIFAREQFGCGPDASPAGGVGSVAPQENFGFRFGMSMPCSACSSITATYTWWEGSSIGYLEAGPGALIASTVTHPSTDNCGANSTSASATYDIGVQMVELDYQRLLRGGCDWAINYNAGVRYGHLDQEFTAEQVTGSASGLTTVSSQVGFDGLGVGLGIDGLCRSPHSGLFAYGRGEAHFMAGDFRAHYLQANQFGGGVNIASNHNEFRTVTVLESELGLGWQTPGGCIRLRAGYQVSGWLNALLMRDYLESIQAGSPDPNADDTMTLSGLVVRLELQH